MDRGHKRVLLRIAAMWLVPPAGASELCSDMAASDHSLPPGHSIDFSGLCGETSGIPLGYGEVLLDIMEKEQGVAAQLLGWFGPSLNWSSLHGSGH